MKLYHNQRQYSRSKVSIAATLTPEGGEAFGVQVADLSMGGMFIHTDTVLEVGARCKVSLLLGHFKHELPMIADAVVVRGFKEGIALKFNSIQLENVASLQHVIVDHADDPEQAELEFSSHGGWIFSPDE
ncbi:MAG: PilZ domain-containing protein [Mariprofundus sp.]